MSQLTDLQDRLALYHEAEARILLRQSYQMPDGRQMTYTQLPAVQAEIRRIEQQIAQLSTSGRLSHAQAVFGGRR
jgi:hypothetical protein